MDITEATITALGNAIKTTLKEEFDRIEKRFDRIEKRMDASDNRMDNLINKHSELVERIVTLEATLRYNKEEFLRERESLNQRLQRNHHETLAKVSDTKSSILETLLVHLSNKKTA